MENIYSIRDEKAESYGVLFTAVTDGCACRVFDQLLATDSQKIGKYPEDFALVCLGTFDPSLGTVDRLPIPRVVVNGMTRIAYFRSLREAVDARTTPPTEDVENA